MPFCGLAVVEALSGIKTEVKDPYLTEVNGWAYQELQPHQAAVIDMVAALGGLTSPAVDGLSASSTANETAAAATATGSMSSLAPEFLVSSGARTSLTGSDAAMVSLLKKLLGSSGYTPERQRVVAQTLLSELS